MKKYEGFKLLVNLYIMNVESLEQYIRDHLLQKSDKKTIVSYLKKRGDYNQNKLEKIITNLF